MQPVTVNLIGHRGSPISEELLFLGADNLPMNMSGYGPFIWQVRRTSTGPLLMQFTLNGASLSTGKLTATATVVQTLALPIQKLYHDLLDVSGSKWLSGSFVVEPNISRI